MRRSQSINMIGAILTGIVLIIVLLTKFTRGAWIVCVAMPIIFLTMKAIRRHYDRVARELVPEPGPPTLPSRVYAVVLVSKLHRPTLRALAFAKASRPHVLEAITVKIDDKDTEALQEEWQRRGIGIDLVVIDSPFREITRPVIKYVRRIRRESPRDVVCIYIPEYVVGPLVGEPAAQPERAAPEEPAAVRAGRHGDERSVPAGVVRSAGGHGRRTARAPVMSAAAGPRRRAPATGGADGRPAAGRVTIRDDACGPPARNRVTGAARAGRGASRTRR